MQILNMGKFCCIKGLQFKPLLLLGNIYFLGLRGKQGLPEDLWDFSFIYGFKFVTWISEQHK